MHTLQKTAAWLTITCLLLPPGLALADEAAQSQTLPYRSQIIINQSAHTPQAKPLSIGGQIYLPLRWTLNSLGVADVQWTPEESPAHQATISFAAPSYFLLQQYHSLLKGLTVDGNDLQHTLPPQLYRISLPPSPLQKDNDLRRSPRALRLDILDGSRTHQLTIYDYLLVDGQYYLSAYWFNQLFGASITEEADQDTVTIIAPSREHWQKELQDLEQQLACGEAKEACELWLMAQEKQSGGLQYALLSAQLRPLAYEQAAARGSWLTAGGGPTFGDASITDEKRLSANKVLYDIQFTEMLSVNPNKTLHQQLTVEKISGTWQITAVTGDTDYYTLLPSGE